MPPEETSLRDELTAAFDQSETPAAETPAVETPTTESSDVTETSPPAAADEPGGEPAERARDAQGRFAKREAPPADAVPPEQPTDAHGKPGTPPAQGASQAPPQPTASGLRAPGSWRPEERAHWASIKPEAQAAILRREYEVNTALRDSHQARQAVAAMQQVIQPFMPNIQAANGGNAVQAIHTLLSADHTLRHGSQSERAQTVANIIKQYGVDVVALDGILAGQPAHDDPQEALARRLRSEWQQQLQPITAYFQQQQQNEYQRQHETMQSAEREVDTFAQNAQYVHFDDVRDEMADLMEVAARRGITMTLAQAYDRALALDPRFAGEVHKAAERKRVNAAAEAAQRAKRAAVSLPSGAAPAGAPNATAANTVRSDLEAAWDAAAGR